MTRHLFLRAAVVSLLAAAVVACTSKVTPENYARVEAGMSREEVHAILGKPTDVKAEDIAGVLSLSKETWVRGERQITITFGNDTVALKSLGKPGEPE